MRRTQKSSAPKSKKNSETAIKKRKPEPLEEPTGGVAPAVEETPREASIADVAPPKPVLPPDPFVVRKAINRAVGEAVGADGKKDYCGDYSAAFELVEAGTRDQMAGLAISFRFGRLASGPYYAAFFNLEDSDDESGPMAIVKAFMKLKRITVG